MENNLRSRIDTISVAIELMTEENLGNAQQLAAYQARMKKLFSLDKFAFVDTDGGDLHLAGDAGQYRRIRF